MNLNLVMGLNEFYKDIIINELYCLKFENNPRFLFIITVEKVFKWF